MSPAHGYKVLLEIATRVGYETDTALRRAFRRVEGVAPGECAANRLIAARFRLLAAFNRHEDFSNTQWV